MGEIAGKIADTIILTDEDPRHEDSYKIISEIEKGVLRINSNASVYKEASRKKAIELAISLARRGDTVGIFGKGHEKSMNYKGVEKPWSDKGAVTSILKHG